MSFDYQSGSDDIYAIAVGQGEYSAGSVKLTNLKKALGETGKAEFELTGGVNGDSWFGIYSTATAPDLQGSTGNAQDFGGYKDFVLDNLKIERIESQTRTKAEAQDKVKEIRGKYDSKRAELSDAAWQQYQDTLVKARVLINKNGATAEDFTKAYDILVALDEYMKTAPGNESSDKYDVAADGSDELGGYTVATGSEEPTAGLPSEGPADLHRMATTAPTGTPAGARTQSATAPHGISQPQRTDHHQRLRYLPRSGGMNANGKIKGYKITLTLADGTTKDVVTDAEFSTTTMWQKASFDAVENVTAVRLTVLSSAGQSDSQANKFASAAELRLTTDREVEEETVAPDKTDLNDTIAKANGLKESDYTAESWTALVKAREAAQAVADNDKATAYDVALALTNLESAIAGLEKTGEEPGPGPVEVNKTDLQTAVNKASKLEKADYTTNSWEAFAEALKAAQQVLDNKNATQQDVDTALSALQDAISKLEAATEPKPNPEPGVVDKAALNATINKAAAINLGLYTDDSANALRAALKKAREVSDNSNATQKQVDAAREALEKAIAGLVKRTAAKGDGNVVSNTGANVVTIAVAGLLLAGAGAAIAYRRNREQM